MKGLSPTRNSNSYVPFWSSALHTAREGKKVSEYMMTRKASSHPGFTSEL